MPELSEFLKEGTTIHIFSKKGLTAPFHFEVENRELGRLSFDSSMEKGEFRSEREVLTILRDNLKQKITLKRGEYERVFYYEESDAEVPMLMTDDCNIFFFKKSSFWKKDVSLIEYESGCWYFRFHPEEEKEAASMKVEVCPIIMDLDHSLDLLVLSVFRLIEGEALGESE